MSVRPGSRPVIAVSSAARSEVFAQMTTIEVQLDPDGLRLHGAVLVDALPIAAAHELFGPPDRIEAAGTPAPHGHRNNQRHFYDTLGLCLLEHHFTRLVTNVTFVFWPEEAVEACSSPFTGSLRVGDLIVRAGMDESALAACGLSFESTLSGSWSVRGAIWIGLTTVGAKQPRGGRSKKLQLVSVSVSLRHDPWDSGASD